MDLLVQDRPKRGIHSQLSDPDLARSRCFIDGQWLAVHDGGLHPVRNPGPPIPFGGTKQSGLGREGSRHGLDEYTELKYLCVALDAAG